MSSPTFSAAPVDPFAIGWRDVTRTRPDGTTVTEQIPLTLEDALHPQLGDVIVEAHQHNVNRTYLTVVIRAAVARDPAALVLSDCKVEWDDPELRHHSPDVAVIFGVREQRRATLSEFLVAEQGVRPALIIELVSPSTRANDVVTKLDHYFRAGVAHYVIVDRAEPDGLLSLRAYQRSPRRYMRTLPDEDGQLWLEAAGLYLGVQDMRVVLYDGETGEELGDYSAISQQLEAERIAREVAEERAAASAERAEAADQRAEAEWQRAEAADQRAEAERQRAEVAEQFSQQLLARMRELGIDPATLSH